jgi:hypothetical protein
VFTKCIQFRVVKRGSERRRDGKVKGYKGVGEKEGSEGGGREREERREDGI